MLAGVSVDYYARLEQGRERTPSPAVLNALAGALALNTDQREHLFRLAGLTPAMAPRVEPTVDAAMRHLLDSWSHTPALIINRQLDILICNPLGATLYGGFTKLDNLARMTFLDPFGRQFFTDWDRATQSCVANLRFALGFPSEADRVRALVLETYDHSEEFRLLWDRGDVRGKTHEPKAFRHPEVGDLLLDLLAFDVRSAPGLQLIAYQAPVGSSSADKIRILSSLAATVPTATNSEL